MAQFNERGQQIPDQTPVEVPLRFTRPLSMQDEIRRFVRQELSNRAADDGAESFEEADDFEVDDDEDLASPYELMAEEPAFKDGSDLTKPEPPPAKPVVPTAEVDNKTLPLPGVPEAGKQ